MTTQEIGLKLIELFRANKHEELYSQLYAQDVNSIEAMPGEGQTAKGMAGITAKNEWWYSNFEVKRCDVGGPWPNGDQFILTFDMETVEKATGKTNAMKEAALYTVRDGKIVEERFFYPFE